MIGQAARPASDRELLEAARVGDPAAIEEIARQSLPVARRVALAITDSSVAEDVASESIEKLLHAIASGSGPTTAIRPYLVRIVRNTAIDTHRRRREYPTDEEFDEPSAAPDPGDQVGDASLVRAAMESLPESWQSVLWMSHVEDLDRTQIAERLGVRPGAVSQLAVRAREGLRQAYLAQYANSTNTSCEAITKRLPAYVRGRSRPTDQAQIKAHLDQCDSCSRLALGLHGINLHLGAAVAISLAGAGAAVLLRPATVAVAATTSPALTPRRVTQVAVGGAAVVLAGSLAWAISSGANPSGKAGTAALSNPSSASSSAPSHSAPTMAGAPSTGTTSSAEPQPAATSKSGTSTEAPGPAPAPGESSTDPQPAPKPTSPKNPTPVAPSPTDTVTVRTPSFTAGGTTGHLIVPITVTKVGTGLRVAMWFASTTTVHQSGKWSCTRSNGGALGGTVVECLLTTTQTDSDLDLVITSSYPTEAAISVWRQQPLTKAASYSMTLQ